MTPFEYMPGDPKFSETFNRGMSDHSIIIRKKILDMYQGFEGLGTVVDVGGGTGAMLNMIVAKFPSVKGINFDLPHVIAEAPPYPGKLPRLLAATPAFSGLCQIIVLNMF